ncbi:MAG: UDP-3-O-(3-hydroxymyristoyl)glucosamine N-acyltransferase [Chitinophagaceae bacterium]|nr:UDP-3-O-(3-hydroxymyristoyl)glucosamine N-acyltransferase [Chitinophagaceae bacterium]
MKSFSIVEISERVKGTLTGNTALVISGPEDLAKANNTQVTFVGSKKFVKAWEASSACAVIVNEDILVEPTEGKAIIKVKDADIAMAEVLEMFMPESVVFETAIHPTAVIHATAKVGEGVRIGAGSYIGKDVSIGANTVVYPNVTIFDNVTIGNNTAIWSGTVIRERCVVGNYCILHSNVTIGADGFGFRPAPDGKGLMKIPHIGNVVIGNGVEIGASSCVDRGKFSATIVGDGCKIDNMIQIGHNSKMGRSCIMAGASGLAGSVTLGDGVVIGGGARISDHVTLGNGVSVGGNSGVINDWPDGAKVLGYPAVDARDALKQWVILRKLVKEAK